MLRQLISQRLRHLRIHLPTTTSFKPNECILIQRSVLHRQCVSHFSSSGPVTTKKTEKFKHPITTVLSNATKVESDGEPLREEQIYLNTLNDPDTFGSSSDDVLFNELTDAGDIAEEKFIENPVRKSKRLSTKEYADMIKEHLSNNRIREALDVLEVRMLQEDRAKPENYIYNLLIGGCARVGYSKKAFNLFTRMKQRGLKVTGGTYTSLFNACATCPWPQDGLKKATRLREIMLEKGYEPNASNYNSMIKAFGRCGDIKTAFELVDEMKMKKLQIEVQTFNFLLQACVSDTEYGFRHALIVWHKMYQRRMLPDLYSFNLLLRCVRDCSIGDIETMQQVISDILLQSKVDGDKLLKVDDNQQLLIESNENQDGGTTEAVEKFEVSLDQAPNLITRYPHLGSLVALHHVKKPEDRLLLLGGAKTILKEMENLKVEPNIKTFTELLEVIPSTNTAEHQIIETIRKLKIKCDVDFFNILIKKRSMRLDYEGAKSVLGMIKIADLEPDIVTYGVLALGCRTIEDSKELLDIMDYKGIRINIQILGAMLRQGCGRRDFPYVIEVLRICKAQQLKPNKQFLEHLHKFNYLCYTWKKENHKYARHQDFNAGYEAFQNKLKQWKQFMGLNKKFDEAVDIVREHPWEQFQSVEASGMEDVKNPKLRKEKKLKRHIRRLTSNKLGVEPVDSLLVKKEK
ncbi:Pentatricopeptide repeat-containing protein 1, mitochondrial [Pseudolycoriella hygida]|uniref:Pentatricopeptide repeat-containing protein 1, mitochondrial n=1 Tax=Pseudolycoriella hygida TaxID=35572 RepID=A0A9Q0S0U5_9DIPT|nr:Pentatricopeptide repeat-containing protein 1, mitochondrial [Pseudolycoriella hygida]